MKKALLIAALTLIPALPAAAQTAAQPKDQQAQNCQAKPDANDQQQKQKQQADTDELSEQLGNCGGVLKPPPTGDKNATPPPPTGSDMPVIKPGEVPPQTGQ
ncbi:hypothetical protein FJW07_06420 [Mesorhizobium sp. B3-1-9]|uniref:hypothetical protein n=1 Tax=unclassified Mesorhizobium TaxID=325217 RepID=UPI001126EA57|nr:MULTISPECIES: hypothetical protein [unclassified Mesorhizobium]TPI40901.1 hypothetical protein FJW07_06420 [Mesorhizobium sp. B3-1-9]TPI70883.1 hypothetical protein FJ424_03365 [Mesorhizobium sp. B3-1-8]TPI74360.1 hypothetical protein FJ420_05350 [Mesorhizobium sp. B3-1-3]TPJ31957.1 hypothetical protein FJ418_20895 [Mesorhizobium sp. B2-8-3]